MTKIRFDRAAGFAAAALFALTMPAQAANTTSNSNSSSRPAAESSQRTDDASERRICVRLQQGGSRITRPVCKTLQEWEASGGVPTAER